ncbi:MAG: retroviral-like aspartic protease family protein [Muribaculaceae bacterium]|nr:retroviral-like aspartic protease family protein [Muribaculaceae bacterium]
MTFYQLHRKTLTIIMCVMAIFISSSASCFASDYVVKMKRKSGVYTIPCEVNGVKRDFIFDTGAANTSLSQEFVNELLQKKRLLQSDFTGVIQTRNASGVVDNNTTINIRQLKVGNRLIYNVRAIIAVSQKAPLLLGMNAIELLGEWTMSKDRLILHNNTEIQPIETTPQDINDDYSYNVDVERETESRSGNAGEVRGNVSHPKIRLNAYNGDAEAQYMMGIMYLNGEGVPADPKMAVHWFRLSAAQGYKIAQLQLAECYSLGVGVEVDERRADYWRKKAEEE